MAPTDVLQCYLRPASSLPYSGNQRLFQQNLMYGLNGYVPATRVGTDTYSMYARHVFATVRSNAPSSSC